jgi:hypothetical protein
MAGVQIRQIWNGARLDHNNRPVDQIDASCMHLPRVLLTVRHNTVHQPGRTVPVTSVRAALTQG